MSSAKRQSHREAYDLWKIRYKNAEEELVNLVPYGTLSEIISAKSRLAQIGKGHADYVEKYREEKFRKWQLKEEE